MHPSVAKQGQTRGPQKGEATTKLTEQSKEQTHEKEKEADLENGKPSQAHTHISAPSPRTKTLQAEPRVMQAMEHSSYPTATPAR